MLPDLSTCSTSKLEVEHHELECDDREGRGAWMSFTCSTCQTHRGAPGRPHQTGVRDVPHQPTITRAGLASELGDEACPQCSEPRTFQVVTRSKWALSGGFDWSLCFLYPVIASWTRTRDASIRTFRTFLHEEPLHPQPWNLPGLKLPNFPLKFILFQGGIHPPRRPWI